MKLPKITHKQQAILDLIYSYRFMTRSQIQAFIGHTDKRRVSAWLLDLREKQYLDWIYDAKNFYAKTRPANYYLGINGTRHFLLQDDSFPTNDVRKRYRESQRSQSYIDRCLMLTEVCLALKQAPHTSGMSTYHYETEAQYMKVSHFSYLAASGLIHPHLCFEKLHGEVNDEPVVVGTYYLEVFDTNYPRYRMVKRLKDYIEYLHDREWEDDVKTDYPPIVLFVCPRTSDLIYAKRRTRGLYSSQDIQDADTPKDERLHIRFTTTEKLKQYGTLTDIWEEA